MLLSTAFGAADIAVKINNKPAGSLEDGDKPSETEAEQKGILVGRSGVSFHNQAADCCI